MVDETELGGVALGLEGAEQGLLGAEDLQRRGRVLGQVGQGAGLLDEAGGDDLADEGGQVGRDGAHLVDQVGVQGAAVLGKLDDATSKGRDVGHVDVRDLATHGDLGLGEDLLGLLLVLIDQGRELVQLVLVEGGLVANVQREAGVCQVVRGNGVQLGKVPAVPLADLLREEVDALVEVVEGGNGADDVVVVLVHVELDLATGVGVAETELGALDVSLLETLEQLGGVQADATEQVGDDLGSVASLALDARELGLDGTGEVLVGQAEDDLALLALGQVELEVGL